MTRRPLALLPLALLLGCPPPARPPTLDPDANSGADAHRSSAQLITLAQPATDDVDYNKGDQTDWKKFDIPKPGVLTVELHWDNAQADVNVDVFNSNGEQIAATPGPQSDPKKTVSVEAPVAGTYFLRIQAAKRNDASVYTVTARLDAGNSAPPPPHNEPPPVANNTPPPPPPPTTPDAGVPPEETTEAPPVDNNDDEGDDLQGTIVSSYRSGSKTVLHLDKGSAAGVRVGTVGEILEGPSGSTGVDGGKLKVTQVIDERHAVAETLLKSLGKNRRVVLKIKR